MCRAIVYYTRHVIAWTCTGILAHACINANSVHLCVHVCVFVCFSVRVCIYKNGFWAEKL